MFFKRVVTLSNLTLIVALALSTVAAYYSIIGLTAIFAGAVIPIIVMGSILEIGKITTTVWLRKYWHRAGWVLKLYLVPAVVLLALLTSMGIFGFLSKAHMETGVTSGDSQSKLALYDEKIKTQKDNIETARKALTQMDAQVDQMLGRTDNDKGAERAVAIRRQQAKERTLLQNDIATAQKEISKLNEERAPIAAENRKIEAEVGPIKYIAALIYGDNADQNMLEAAVRWVIILLVVVFDPLAIALVLAANASKEWDEEQSDEIFEDGYQTPLPYVADVGEKPTVEELAVTEEEEEAFKALEPEPEKTIAEQHPYLNEPFVHFENLTPMVHKPEEPEQEPEVITVDSTESIKEIPDEVLHVYDDERLVTNNDKKILAMGVDVIDRPGDYVTPPEVIETEGVTKEAPLRDLGDGYVLYNGAHYGKQALKEMRPELFMAKPDNGNQVKTNFGIKFPAIANKGDIFVRVDALPNRVYKFNDNRWIELNKTTSDSYLYDQEYIKYLVNKISSGEYDVELLTDNERAQIEEYLGAQKDA